MRHEAVLVTGATGFLGRSLVNRLVAEGYRVTALGYKSTISPFIPDVEYVQVDLTDFDRSKEALVPWRWNSVVNLAGSVLRGEGAWQLSYPLVRNHVTIALNLCLCIPDHWRGRYIHSSSMTVYGIPQRELVDEDHPRLPLDDYGFAKALAEDVIWSWRQRYSTDCWILRFPGLFSEDRDSGALQHFISSALKRSPLVITASRPTPWDVLHVRDAAEAIVRVLRSNCYGPGPLNISYGEPVELEAISRLILKITQSQSEVQNVSKINHPVFQMDISRAKQLLDWPPCTLRQSLELMCKAIESKIDAKNAK